MNIGGCGVAIRRAVLNPGFNPGDTRQNEECRAAMERGAILPCAGWVLIYVGGILSRPTSLDCGMSCE